jgi:hypothetical protein
VQHYKNYPIYLTAVPMHGGGWKARGIVLDPATSTKELKRVQTGESIFSDTKEEAEAIALVLCQAWIDGLEKNHKPST